MIFHHGPLWHLSWLNHHKQKSILQRSSEELLTAWGKLWRVHLSYSLSALHCIPLEFFLGSLALPRQGTRKVRSPASFLGLSKSFGPYVFTWKTPYLVDCLMTRQACFHCSLINTPHTLLCMGTMGSLIHFDILTIKTEQSMWSFRQSVALVCFGCAVGDNRSEVLSALAEIASTTDLTPHLSWGYWEGWARHLQTGGLFMGIPL